jgi:hypothetical protein
VLLFKRQFHEGLVSGAITLTYRLWPKARVRPGSRYRCHPIGVLVVDSVDRVRVSEITEPEAVQAGFSDCRALLACLQGLSETPISGSTEVFRVAIHYGGEGDFVETAQECDITDEAFSRLSTQLNRMDSSSPCGPWTRATLDLIGSHPRIAASLLARMVQREGSLVCCGCTAAFADRHRSVQTHSAAFALRLRMTEP